MKKLSLKKVALAGTFAAAAVVPATIFADATVTINVPDTVNVNTNSLAEYADGYELELDFSESPEYVSVKASEKTVTIEGSKATIKVPVLSDDGLSVAEGSKTFPITLVDGDGGETDAEIKYTVAAVNPRVTYDLDITISKEIEIKESVKNEYADGLTITIDATSLNDNGEFVSISPETGGTYNLVGGKADIVVPVLKADGSVDEGTKTVALAFNRADGSSENGSVKYTVKYTNDQNDTPDGDNSGNNDPVTEKTITFAGNVSVKVNGVPITSGKKAIAGDKITVTASAVRGKKIAGISVNNAKLTMNGNSAEYTVKADDTNIEIVTDYTNADSYTITIPASVTAQVISDDGNVTLASGDNVYDGENIKITAVNPDGKVLKSLTLNGGVIENGQTVTVNGTDLVIAADYDQVAQFTLTIPENITVTRDGTALKTGSIVSEGDKLVITAAKDGCTVKSLTVNGNAFVSGSMLTVSNAGVNIAVEFVNGSTTDVGDTFPITIKVYDGEDSPLKGVTILVKDANKKTIATAETDKKGTITLDVAAGRYTYVVTDVPDGYITSSDSYTITVSDAGKVKGTTNVTVALSEVTLTKTDSITKNGVAGISIIVKNSDKETVATGTTDSKGKLVITGLAEGKYTYTERYPAAGYASDDTVYTFSIDDEGNVTGTTSSTVTPVSITFTVRDYATGKGISGATLQIKNQLGRTVATITTDANGEASVPGLAAGRYTLSQSSAPDGYSKDSSEYTFDVLASGLVSGTTSVSNKAKASSNSGSNISSTNNSSSSTSGGSQSATTPNGGTTNSSGNTSGTATNGTTGTAGTTTSTTTSGTTTVNGKPFLSTVKTGVETTAAKSKAPIVACIIGTVGIVAGAASVAVSKLRRKNNNDDIDR